MMNCTKCGKWFDRDGILPKELLRRYIVNPTIEGYTCGTICPHCGHENDAPGFVPGDEIPHTCPDGVVVCADRYLPPQPVIHPDKWYGEGYTGPR